MDSYDAMSSRRLYRRPFTYPECLEELKRCRGTQFDPRMVDAFLRVLGRLATVRQAAMAAAAEAAALIDPEKHLRCASAATRRGPTTPRSPPRCARCAAGTPASPT